MVWKYPDKTGTIIELRPAGTPIQPEWSPTKPEAYSGRNFGGTCGANSGEAADPIKALLQNKGAALIQLMGRAVQGDAYSHDSLHIIAAVDSHQVDETRVPATHRPREKNHCEHDLRGLPGFGEPAASRGPTGAP